VRAGVLVLRAVGRALPELMLRQCLLQQRLLSPLAVSMTVLSAAAAASVAMLERPLRCPQQPLRCVLAPLCSRCLPASWMLAGPADVMTTGAVPVMSRRCLHWMVPLLQVAPALSCSGAWLSGGAPHTALRRAFSAGSAAGWTGPLTAPPRIAPASKPWHQEGISAWWHT
jgi:hypothetical protein